MEALGWSLTKSGLRRTALRVDFVNLQEPASGIVHVRVRGSRAYGAGAVLKLCVDGNTTFEATLEPEAEPKHDILLDVGLHCALLDNGKHDVVLEVWQGDKLRDTARASLTTHNAGPVAEMARSGMRQAGTPLVVRNGAFDSGLYPDHGEVPAMWFDQCDAQAQIEAQLADGKISAEEAAKLTQFVEQGYVVLEDLVAPQTVARVNAEIDAAVASGWEGYQYGSSQRIAQLHRKYPEIRKLWQSEAYLRWVRLIFRDEPLPCQSLTYLFGSQQDAHQDTIHLTPFPAGAMCGVWIALEDIQPDSGELIVYPGSHRLERVYMRSIGCPKVSGSDWSTFGSTVVRHWATMIEQHALQPEVYRPRAGSVLIWHENLLHAGSHRIDQSLTRRSIVFHCFAQGALAYYDSTGVIGYTFRPD